MTLAEPSHPARDWPRTGEEFGPSVFGPFAPDDLARYAAASGDDNPLHLDETVAAAAGLGAPPVQGMLLMSCFEPAIRAWRSDIGVERLSAKFLRPVLCGEMVRVFGRVVRSSPAELVLRLTLRNGAGDIAVLGEATLVATAATIAA